MGKRVTKKADDPQTAQAIVDLYQQMADAWGSPIVPRSKIEEFTGGLISGKYLANLDSAGQGIPGAIRCGNKVAYPTKSLVMWLTARSNSISHQEE